MPGRTRLPWGWMSEATEQTQRKRDSKGTQQGLSRQRPTAVLTERDCTFLCLKKWITSMPCYEGGMGGRKDHRNGNNLKINLRNVLTQAGTCSMMEGECSTARITAVGN